jgi:hypothetical protein
MLILFSLVVVFEWRSAVVEQTPPPPAARMLRP